MLDGVFIVGKYEPREHPPDGWVIDDIKAGEIGRAKLETHPRYHQKFFVEAKVDLKKDELIDILGQYEVLGYCGYCGYALLDEYTCPACSFQKKNGLTIERWW